MYRQGELVQPDDDLKAAGPWPNDLEKPKGMVRYRPSRFTQEIAVTDNQDRIIPVLRDKLEDHWKVPGGLVVAKGWRSDLYKYVPVQYHEYVGDISVLNSLGYFQSNRGWKRSYPNGTYFADVLSNDKGEVFEVRYREKDNGKWFNTVAYRNVNARPKGYFRINTTQCNSCHNQAGTGGYAVGLVPGGDTVLSDPFLALER